jgi:hypothetical protein
MALEAALMAAKVSIHDSPAGGDGQGPLSLGLQATSAEGGGGTFGGGDGGAGAQYRPRVSAVQAFVREHRVRELHAAGGAAAWALSGGLGLHGAAAASGADRLKRLPAAPVRCQPHGLPARIPDAKSCQPNHTPRPPTPPFAGQPLPPELLSELQELVAACVESCAAALDVTSREALWPLGSAERGGTAGNGSGADAGADGASKAPDKQRWLQVRRVAFERAGALLPLQRRAACTAPLQLLACLACLLRRTPHPRCAPHGSPPILISSQRSRTRFIIAPSPQTDGTLPPPHPTRPTRPTRPTPAPKPNPTQPNPRSWLTSASQTTR